MANPSKDKGDRAEREAVAMLVDLAPELVVEKAQRMLGAGRKEDVGDLHVFPDVAVQVRNLKVLGQAVRSSALDSVIQAANGRLPLGLGLVPVANARKESVRWLACTVPNHWPMQHTGDIFDFALISKAVAWLRIDTPPYGFRAYPRIERIARLTGGLADDEILVAPVEAWIASYAAYRRHQEDGRHLALVSG